MRNAKTYVPQLLCPQPTKESDQTAFFLRNALTLVPRNNLARYNREKLLQINANTAQLQSELWSAVRAPAATQATPVLALAISGMSEVLNSQGYTQAAWWDRIPLAAWGMMAAIAICANLLVGYGARQAKIFRADSGDDATCHRLGFFPDF